MTVSPMALPPKTEAISARIIPWDDDVGIGVAYGFQAGKHQAGPITDDDWPSIRRLASGEADLHQRRGARARAAIEHGWAIAMSLDPWPYRINEAARELYLWQDDHLGIAYTWADGYGEVGPEDWPQIRHLDRAGKLSYRWEAARELYRKLQGRKVHQG